MRRGQLVVDGAIAAVALALTLGMLAGHRFEEGDAGARDIDLLGVVLAVLASAPLAGRRVAPVPVFGVVTTATALLYALDYGLGPPLGLALALYTVAATPEPRVRPLVLLGLFVPFAAVSQHVIPPDPELILGAVVWLAAWFAGDRTRLRRERLADLEERALRAERDAERDRRLAVAEERTRIARDLHDSAGHAINVILVQAGAARLLHERDPERSLASLETIEDVARETIGEIDQLVRVLREDRALGDRVEAPPGLAALDALVQRHRAAGLAVTAHLAGPRLPLAPGVDRAAYRIIQEALTNAARHGNGNAQLDIAFAPGALEIAIANPTLRDPAARVAGGGRGIVGMRERAALLGGSLEAGASDGVFRVRARLPYGDGGNA
jgi:signal transduction histidine kinase